MAKYMKSATMAVIGAIVGSAVTVAMWSATAANAPSKVSRFVDGHPTLNGIWQAVNTANWDLEDHAAAAGPAQIGAIGAMPPGPGVVEGGSIPYQPSAAAKRKENFAQRWTLDPEVKCYLPGVPRATYMPHPFQIVQSTDKIMILYGYDEAVRVIHLDKAKPEPAPIDTWMGRSHGHWEGDTLVVDVAGFNGQFWFDRAGNFASDALHVVERYTPIDADHLMYEAAMEDPQVFTRPWKISMPVYRRIEKDVQLPEFKCVEFTEELLYGHLRKQKSN